MQGLIGRKIGMTRIFTKDGISIPITVVEITQNRITQIKSLKKDGYFAVQVTTGKKKSNHITKPEIGHFLKAGVEAGRGLWEFRITENDKENLTDNMTIKLFYDIKRVDITGTSIGKGFAGTIKRWNFHMQDASHGNSRSHRAPGSVGQNQTPGRIFKEKKMAGQLGNVRITVQNLKIIKIDEIRNLLLVKGAVPGIVGGNLIITPAIKK